MADWRSVLLKSDDTLGDAIKVLNRVPLKIVMVVDEQRSLLGTVVDGDIRRALSQHHGMDTHLVDVMFRDPTFASTKDDRKGILAMMKSKDILQIPILDADRKIVGLETLQHLLENTKLDNPVFLMAGGVGTRLQPLTNDTPKPLLKVGPKPILETILGQFVEAGFHNFYISTHYKAEMFRKHFGDGSQWGVNIQYVHEEEPLGTAGSLGLLPKSLPELPILMMNGDLLTKVNFEYLLNFHNEQGGIATMCVREYNFQVPYGVIQAEGYRIMSIVEKPVHKFFVNAGIYILSPSLVRSVDGRSYLDMPNLLEKEIEKDSQVNMYPVHEYWVDIGHMEEYERANKEIFNLIRF